METESIHVVGLQLFVRWLRREPFPVGECEFEFVTIELNIFRTKNRFNLTDVNLSDACQIIYDLFLFESKLLFIGKMLPLATAACTEVLSELLNAQV